MTFGGWRDDLMLVVSREALDKRHHGNVMTDRLIFSLSKPKVPFFSFDWCSNWFFVEYNPWILSPWQVLEATMLMASYINSQHKSFKNLVTAAKAATHESQSSGLSLSDAQTNDKKPSERPALQMKPKFMLSMEVWNGKNMICWPNLQIYTNFCDSCSSFVGNLMSQCISLLWNGTFPCVQLVWNQIWMSKSPPSSHFVWDGFKQFVSGWVQYDGGWSVRVWSVILPCQLHHYRL